MKLIRPSYEIIEQGPGLQGIYDIIERCGKTSYKSEVKGGDTARKFLQSRIHPAVECRNHRHLAVCRPARLDERHWHRGRST